MSDFEGEIQEDPCVANLLAEIESRLSNLRSLEADGAATPSALAEAHQAVGRLYGTLALARRIEGLRGRRSSTMAALGSTARIIGVDPDGIGDGLQLLGSVITIQSAILQAQAEMERRNLEGIFEGPDWIPGYSMRPGKWGDLADES